MWGLATKAEGAKLLQFLVPNQIQKLQGKKRKKV
jgi:hypothetical protein